MRRYKYKKKNRIMLLLILVLGIAIGYSLLGSTLKIDGFSGINKNTWDIHWNSETIHETEGSVTPKEAVHVDQEDNKNIAFDVEFELPGDFYEFTIDAKNYGTIDGAVDKIDVKFYDNSDEEIESLPSYYKYSLTHIDGSEIKDNEVIKQNESIGYKFRVEFDRNATSIPQTTKIKPVVTIDVQQAKLTTVTFNPNGGTVSPTTKAVAQGDKIGELPTPTRDRYSFKGWYTSLNNGTLVDSEYVVESSTTLYALWEAPYAMFVTGSDFQSILNSMEMSDFCSLELADELPDLDDPSILHHDILSAQDSPYPIYGWTDNNYTLYYWSEAEKYYLNPDSSYMFAEQSYFNDADFSKLDTSKVTNMSHMFYGCEDMNVMDLSSWDTRNVVNMESMFEETTELNSLDLSNWNTGKVTNMSNMFKSCYASELNLSGWNTEKVTNMSNMFNYSNASELDLSGWDISKVTNMSNMFGSAHASELDLSGWDITHVTSMTDIFDDCSSLTELNISGWNMSNQNVSNRIFEDCQSIETINLTDTVLPVDSSYLFYHLDRLATLTGIEDVDTSHVTTMENMFDECSSYHPNSLDLSSWDTSHVTDMSYMFSGTGADNLNLSGWDLSSLTDIGFIFYGSGFNSLNISGWDLSQQTFNGSDILVSSETGITTLNVTNLKLPSYSSNFFSASSLEEIIGLPTVDASAATEMFELFAYNKNLTSLDLSGWDTSHVTTMESIFSGCSELTSLNISGWDMSSLSGVMSIYEFVYECENLQTLNLTNVKLPSDSTGLFMDLVALEEIVGSTTIDMTGVSTLHGIFSGCTALTSIDISGWNLTNVDSIAYMFSGCSSLTTIYANNDDWSEIDAGDVSLFEGCTSIVGGAGTTYDSEYAGKEYARVDTAGNPGYFTHRNPTTNTTGNKKNTNYTVNFNANGGNNIHEYIIVRSGSKVGFLPTPTKEGYKFQGWFTGLTDGVKVDDSYIPTSNTTLYARWIVK